MKLPEIEETIAVLFSEDGGPDDPFIRGLLAQYLAVQVCGAYEEQIRSIVVERARRGGDPELAAFVEHAVRRIVRNAAVDAIGGLLKGFGTGPVSRFDLKRSGPGGERAATAFGNIVRARHDFAHGARTMTYSMEDMRRDYEASHCVLDWLQEALQ